MNKKGLVAGMVKKESFFSPTRSGINKHRQSYGPIYGSLISQSSTHLN